MEVINDKRNDLFKRQELFFTMENVGAPSFEFMKGKVSEQVDMPVENIDVRRIKGGFGKNTFSVEAFVYDSEDDLNKAKVLTKKQRKEIEEKKKQEEEESKKAAEESVKEEEKSEETKEENVEEVKKEESDEKPSE